MGIVAWLASVAAADQYKAGITKINGKIIHPIATLGLLPVSLKVELAFGETMRTHGYKVVSQQEIIALMEKNGINQSDLLNSANAEKLRAQGLDAILICETELSNMSSPKALEFTLYSTTFPNQRIHVSWKDGHYTEIENVHAVTLDTGLFEAANQMIEALHNHLRRGAEKALRI